MKNIILPLCLILIVTSTQGFANKILSSITLQTVNQTTNFESERSIAKLQNSINDLNGFTDKKLAKNKIIKGKKHGKWINYLDENFDEINKETAAYYELVVYKNGKKTGMVRTYFITGALYSETPYTNKGDLLNGMRRVYFSNGKTDNEGHYSKCLKNGVFKFYYESGQLKLEVPYKNGKINGTIKQYFENGQLEFEAPYVNGKKSGTVKYTDCP